MNFLKSNLLLVVLATSVLALTPAERKLVERAKTHLQEAKKEKAASDAEVILADQRATESENHVKETDDKLVTLNGDIKKAHDNEKILAAENDKMRPVYEKCNRWWGIGAIAWGFGRLFRNLLITAVALAVLAGVLWGLSFFFPVIAVGVKLAWGFVRSIGSRIAALLAKLKKREP